MSAFSKYNPCLRKFPSVSAIGVSLENRRARTSVTGSPYVSLDRLAVGLLWGSALFAAFLLWVMSPWLVLPWVLAGAPVSVGVACLLARMVNRTWFAQAVAITYMLSVLGLLFFLGGG